MSKPKTAAEQAGYKPDSKKNVIEVDENDPLVKIFRHLDVDKDGTVSKTELIAALRKSDAAKQRMNLNKGATQAVGTTFSKEFAEIAGENYKTITLHAFLQNMGIIHFLLLEQEEKELKAKAKK